MIVLSIPGPGAAGTARQKVSYSSGVTEDGHSWDSENTEIQEERNTPRSLHDNSARDGGNMDSYEMYYKQKTDTDAYDKAGHKKRMNGASPAVKSSTTGPQKNVKKISSKKSAGKSENAGFTYYRVKKGDTLYRIAKKFKIDKSALAECNGLTKNSKITKDKVLKIPATAVQGNKKTARENGENQTADNGPSPKFIWPVKAIRDYRRDGINGVKPIGLIISGTPGAAVVSSSEGVVKKIGRMRGFGRYIIIEHSNRYMTVYSNLKNISVSAGQFINTGTEIGKIDNTDNTLHFQIDYAGKPMNPLKYLPRKS